jgi:hypothetical protein
LGKVFEVGAEERPIGLDVLGRDAEGDRGGGGRQVLVLVQFVVLQLVGAEGADADPGGVDQVALEETAARNQDVDVRRLGRHDRLRGRRAVWANCHGSYVLGLALLGSWLLGRAVSAYFSRRTLRLDALFAEPRLRRLLLALVLSTAAVALVNPHGPFIFLDTWRMGQNANVALMDEWQSIDFHEFGLAVWVFLLSVTFLLLTQLVSKRLFSPG